jgi:hypothetical protein
MTEDDLIRFEHATGMPLPRRMLQLGAMSPYLENDIDKLIELNSRVRIPGDTWMGTAGDPWPAAHVVIGEDCCGNYYSVLSPDKNNAEFNVVWFYDHDAATMEEFQCDIGSFLVYLEVNFPVPKFEVGDWQVIANQSVGPLKFGMPRAEVRAVLDQPFTEFAKGLSEELTDAFDTLSLHVFYRDGGVEAVEFWEAGNIKIGGHRLGDETFTNMTQILFDQFFPTIITGTSYQSKSYGVEFTIEDPEDRDKIGAIKHVIVVEKGYFERGEAMLAAILGGDQDTSLAQTNAIKMPTDSGLK